MSDLPIVHVDIAKCVAPTPVDEEKLVDDFFAGRIPLTPPWLDRIGQEIHGFHWQTPMAEGLRIPTRRVRAWLAGSEEMPTDLPARLVTLAAARIQQIKNIQM